MPRRPRNSTGTVRSYDTKDGRRRWQGIVSTWDPIEGRPKQTSKVFDTYAEAVQWKNDTIAERNKTGYRPPKKQTVKEYLDYWLRTHVQVNLRPSTLRSYKQLIELHVLPTLGEEKLADLTPHQLQAWVADLALKESGQPQGGTLSPRTVAYIRSILHAALAEAVRLNVLPVNPLDRVRPPKQKPKRVQSFTLQQVRTLEPVLEGHRIGSLFTFLWQTGLRIGEAMALTWHDVDLQAGTLTVERNLVEVGGDLIEGVPKTAAGTREIALAPQTVELLRAHKERQDVERLLVDDKTWNPEGYVWCSVDGEPITRSYADHVWRRLRDKAGLPKYGLHALRHTAASLQLQAGVGIPEIAASLGHESPAFTA